jgi:hypothetical protein
MSALPPKADIRRREWNVRFVPKADILRRGKVRCYSITSSARPIAADVDSLEVAAVVAAEAAAPAGHGFQVGAGSTPAGLSLHQRLRYLLSRQSNPHRQQRLWEKVISSPHEPNSVRRLRRAENHATVNPCG